MHTLYVAMEESDQSLRGLAMGERLAAQLGASLAVVSVVPEAHQVEPRQAALQCRLDAAGAAWPIETLAHASVKDTLAELAGRDDAWLCMGAHGRRPVPEMLIGSVTAGVVRRARRPLFLCGPRFDADAHRSVEVVMVCVDGSPLSEAMLPHAVSLSQRLGARLQLLQVIDAAALAAVPGEGGHADVMESGYVHGLARRLRREHAIEVDWEVLHGDPADALVSYLGECRNVMLAMTTHGRSGLSQVVAGSVSHEVLHEAPCPVAVWRPPHRR